MKRWRTREGVKSDVKQYTLLFIVLRPNAGIREEYHQAVYIHPRETSGTKACRRQNMTYREEKNEKQEAGGTKSQVDTRRE